MYMKFPRSEVSFIECVTHQITNHEECHGTLLLGSKILIHQKFQSSIVTSITSFIYQKWYSSEVSAIRGAIHHTF